MTVEITANTQDLRLLGFAPGSRWVVYEGPGARAPDDPCQWVQCPKKIDGYLLLEPGEYQRIS